MVNVGFCGECVKEFFVGYCVKVISKIEWYRFIGEKFIGFSCL